MDDTDDGILVLDVQEEEDYEDEANWPHPWTINDEDDAGYDDPDPKPDDPCWIYDRELGKMVKTTNREADEYFKSIWEAKVKEREEEKRKLSKPRDEDDYENEAKWPHMWNMDEDDGTPVNPDDPCWVYNWELKKFIKTTNREADEYIAKVKENNFKRRNCNAHN